MWLLIVHIPMFLAEGSLFPVLQGRHTVQNVDQRNCLTVDQMYETVASVFSSREL